MKVTCWLFLLSLTLNLYWLWPLDWSILPAALLGWAMADLASGLAHIYLDYRPCRTGVGLDRLFFYEGSRESAEYLALRAATFARINALEKVVFDFKTHHPRPLALTHRSFVALIGSTAVVALPVSVALSLMQWRWHLPAWAGAALVAFLIGSTGAQYFHSVMHRDDVPVVVWLLRRLGLLMTPEAHASHHTSFREGFAIVSGWSNPLLNWVFAALRRRGHFSDEGLEPRG